MANILLSIDIIAALAMVVLVLLQQGRGSDMGAAFGGSQTVFGSRGSANFLSRVTAVLAAIFFSCSLGLAYIYSKSTDVKSVTEVVPVIEQQDEQVPTTSDIPALPGAKKPVADTTADENPGLPSLPSVPESSETKP